MDGIGDFEGNDVENGDGVDNDKREPAVGGE